MPTWCSLSMCRVLGVPLGTIGARARQLRADHLAVLQSDSYHPARSRTAELGERQHVALAGACADRRGYGGGACRRCSSRCASVWRRNAEAAQASARADGPRVEAIYRDTRKKSEEWIKKTWDEKPISQARFFSEINQRVQGKSWALVSSHGRRWREAIEVTEPAHGMGGGRGGGVGYGLPSSIGSALGFKGSGRLCVSILGDGDFLDDVERAVDGGEISDSAAWSSCSTITRTTTTKSIRSAWRAGAHRPVENKGIGIRIEDPVPDLCDHRARVQRRRLRPDHRTGRSRSGARQSDPDRRKRQAGGRRRVHAAAVAVRRFGKFIAEARRRRREFIQHPLARC